MLRSFRPELESLDIYLIRLDRQAAAAERLGAAMEDELLMVIKAKANLENQMWEAAPNDPIEGVRLLKREYAFEMMDLKDDDPVQRATIEALELLLEGRGVNVTQLREQVVSGGDPSLLSRVCSITSAFNIPLETTHGQ